MPGRRRVNMLDRPGSLLDWNGSLLGWAGKQPVQISSGGYDRGLMCQPLCGVCSQLAGSNIVGHGSQNSQDSIQEALEKVPAACLSIP